MAAMAKVWGPSKENLAAARAARTEKNAGISEREKILARGIVGGLSQKAAFAKAGYAAGVDRSEILQRPRVIHYLRELHDRQVERLDYSIDNLCARLEHIAYAAIDDRQYAAAVSAVMGVAKLMGHLADRSEIEMHIIAKPAREPTKETVLSPEEWQRLFAPKLIQ
jgi:hypothetical protein